MVFTSLQGFPRIGEKRELKRALEAFWKEEISGEELLAAAAEIKERNISNAKGAGIDIIPSNDFSLYDHLLDHSVMLGQVPKRYLELGDPLSLDVYFAMARGKEKLAPLEMTKWFDTNYHYIVPELCERFTLLYNRPLEEYRLAKSQTGTKTKPVIVGAYTYLKLAKIRDGKAFEARLLSLKEPYSRMLSELSREGVEYVQIDEPALVLGEDPQIVKLAGQIYGEVAKASKESSKWILQTYFEDMQEHLSEVCDWPFDYVGIDLVRGQWDIERLKKLDFGAERKLALGIVDGRNVWKSDRAAISRKLDEFEKADLLKNAVIQPSCSLMFVPYSTKFETALPAEIKNLLAFGIEKMEELSSIKADLSAGMSKDTGEIMNPFRSFEDPLVKKRMDDTKDSDFARALPFPERYKLQSKRLKLPLLPTTTIGSFPQTKDLRMTRAAWKSKKMTDEDYAGFIKDEIVKVLSLQEQIGLDILVHGEFERTDMVEFFAEKLKGFTFTKNGWVQSYGSRCVKPPIIYGDVSRTKPMTVAEVSYAQTQTSRPVKGMLTGPITILNWSFPRNDIARHEIACQIALSLRDECADLEKAGIKIIQIDEPAIREGLPLKKAKRQDYLKWAVKAFRLCSSGVKDNTQIHTHMCYSEFNEIIRSIYDLDADVISIENARSSDELLSVFKEFDYDHGIGPGVYDIHSPRVPSQEEIEDKIGKILKHLKKELLWINPDCGLKTRDYPESVKSLRNMVEAAKKVRENLK